MAAARFWAVLEHICRILGIVTAAVLLGVGIDTAVQGQFRKLAAYLLFAAAVLTILEGPYFIDAVLVGRYPTLFDKMDSKIWNIWKKAMRPNGLQKCLTFTFLSVACFLHPVLIWQATIPGTMLILSGLAYFVLNLRKRFQTNMPDGTQRCSQEYITAVTLTDAGEMEQTYSFHRDIEKRKLAVANCVRNVFKLNSGRPLSNEGVRTRQDSVACNASLNMKSRHAPFEENVIKIIPSEPDALEEQKMESVETTSDKVPILPK
ncbi:transmembrane protein 72 [Scyliorhinus canicula]|uniref:transmembrane protein 72 n=1 Tax=Scyliorhinus canicula TaxID=7830 RepID=UPI0018F31C1C|nr:transmembrane protein 72 [Scyliorhinus canicula]